MVQYLSVSFLIMLYVLKLLFIKPVEWFVWEPERIFAVSCGLFFCYFVICLFSRKSLSMRSWWVIAWILIAIWAWFFTIKKSNLGKRMYPMELFVREPGRIFAVSCIFFFGYFIIRLFSRKLSSVRSWPLLIPAITWGLYAIWEWFCTVKKGNIRVDLFLIYPILIVVSIFGLSVSIGSVTSSFLKK